MFTASTFVSCSAHNVPWCGQCQAQPVACEATVVVVSPARYNYVPVCTCGWKGRGYVAAHAARDMAAAHAAA